MEIERAPAQARSEPPASDESPQSRGRWNQTLLRLVGLKAPSHTPTLANPLVAPQKPGAQHGDAGLPRREKVRDADDSEPALSAWRIGRANERDAAGQTAGLATAREGVESPPSTASASVFSNMGASIGRSVLSAMSDISSVGSISLGTDVLEVQKGVFVAPRVAIPGEHLENWSVIRPRLEDTLRHLFRTAKGLDPTMSLEFMMAGPSRSQFRPSIIIVCCSSSYMKQLKKILKSQKWIGGYGYPCMVLVDPLKQLADFIQELSASSWIAEEAMPAESGVRRGGLQLKKIVPTGILILMPLVIASVLVLSGQRAVYLDGILGTLIKRDVGSEPLSPRAATAIVSVMLSILLLIAALVTFQYCHARRARSYRRLEDYGGIRGNVHAGTMPDNYQQLESQESSLNHGPITSPDPSPTAWPSWREDHPQNHTGEYSGRHGTASAIPDTSPHLGSGGGGLTGWGVEMVTLSPEGGSQKGKAKDRRGEPAVDAQTIPRIGVNDFTGTSHKIENADMHDSSVGLTKFGEGIWPLTIPLPHSNSGSRAYERVDIFARVRSQSPSTCGMLVEAVIYPAKQVSFTLGGVILVGGRQYGLTTRHSFEPGSNQWAESSELEETEDEDEDESPYISFDDDSNDDDVISSPASSPSSSPHPESSYMLGETPETRLKGKSRQVSPSEMYNASTGYEHIGVLSELGFRYTDTVTGREERSLDWALIELDSSAELNITPTTPMPGSMRPAKLSTIIKTDLMEDSQVFIQAGVSGTTTGWLRSCPVHMHFQGSSFEARQIVLDGPLGKNRPQIPLHRLQLTLF